MSAPLLTVEGLEVRYHTEEAVLPALHDVSFAVHPGEIVGVVGVRSHGGILGAAHGCEHDGVKGALLTPSIAPDLRWN